MLQFHLFGWISSYLTRPGFATIKYWIELYWQYIGLFGGFARIPLQAPGFSRVYSGSIYNDTRDPFFFLHFRGGLFIHVPSIRRTNRTNSSGACFWLMAATWVAINTAMDTTSKRCRYCLRFQYLDPIPENSKAGKIMISWKRWIKVMTLVTTTLWV